MYASMLTWDGSAHVSRCTLVCILTMKRAKANTSILVSHAPLSLLGKGLWLSLPLPHLAGLATQLALISNLHPPHPIY